MALTHVRPGFAEESQEPAHGRSHLLWFDKPAAQWADALPLGNGRLGAMVFGGHATERIALNEDTLWSGAPKNWNNPDAVKHLPEVRKLVLGEKDYPAADQVMRKMQGPFNDAYEPLGDLTIEMDHGDEVTGYRRELDLDRGLCRVTYEANGTRYVRESFVSHPAQMVVVRLSAVGGAGFNAVVGLRSALRAKSAAPDERTIHLTGKAPSISVPNYLESDDPIRYSEEAGKGMYFAASLRADATGGTVKSMADGRLAIRSARSVVLRVGMATGYRGYAVAPDLPAEKVLAAAKRPLAEAKTYAALYAEHLHDHQRLYRRATLDLGSTNDGSALPTDQRVSGFEGRPDPALLALYFNYGQ